jgi:hypothetical protein
MFQAAPYQQGKKYEWTSTNLYMRIMWNVAQNRNLFSILLQLNNLHPQGNELLK